MVDFSTQLGMTQKEYRGYKRAGARMYECDYVFLKWTDSGETYFVNPKGCEKMAQMDLLGTGGRILFYIESQLRFDVQYNNLARCWVKDVAKTLKIQPSTAKKYLDKLCEDGYFYKICEAGKFVGYSLNESIGFLDIVDWEGDSDIFLETSLLLQYEEACREWNALEEENKKVKKSSRGKKVVRNENDEQEK